MIVGLSEEATMTGLDALQSVRFVTRKGKRLAILNAEDWEALIEWLETLEDIQIARQAFAELKAAKGNRRRAGWLEWDAVEDELK
jgi:PHD/YefM family antitoxin component YafN of YafNO toxin-antitoxin module